ncbi:hypothetical protein KY329_05380 [Candidatus Woesearchaeota archaeon]|nr:hypothetical protein [Candidatus Woesearchaeota archaeon]
MVKTKSIRKTAPPKESEQEFYMCMRDGRVPPKASYNHIEEPVPTELVGRVDTRADVFALIVDASGCIVDKIFKAYKNVSAPDIPGPVLEKLKGNYPIDAPMLIPVALSARLDEIIGNRKTPFYLTEAELDEFYSND